MPLLIWPHPRRLVREEAREHRREAHRDLHVLPPLGQDDKVAATVVPCAGELELKNRDEVALVTPPDVLMPGGWVANVRVPRRQVRRGLETPTPIDHRLVRRRLGCSRTLGEAPAYAVDLTPILPLKYGGKDHPATREVESLDGESARVSGSTPSHAPSRRRCGRSKRGDPTHP